MIKVICIFSVLLLNSLFAGDKIRSCLKNDLVGDVWYITHMKVFDSEKLKNPTNYLSILISEIQMIKFTKDGEIRSLYSKNYTDATITASQNLEIMSKMLDFSQGEFFEITKDEILTIVKDGKHIDSMLCYYYIDEQKEVNIKKGSISLIRYEDDKPLIGLVYKRMTQADFMKINEN